jgi:hypothetical protein
VIDLGKERRARGVKRVQQAIEHAGHTIIEALNAVGESIEALDIIEQSDPIQLIDFATAAKRLGISEPSVFNLVRRGKIPVVEIPSGHGDRRMRKIDARELERCIAAWSEHDT